MVRGAANAINWYTEALGASEVIRLEDPSGHIMHAEISIGGWPVMLADEFPDEGYVGPQTLGGSPVLLLLYVDDVDVVFSQALAHGAVEKQPVSDQFDGDRRGSLVDPFGHVWLLASRLEELSTDDIKERFARLTCDESTRTMPVTSSGYLEAKSRT
jgi:PhnB protein